MASLLHLIRSLGDLMALKSFGGYVNRWIVQMWLNDSFE